MNLKIDDINNNQKHAVPSEEEIAGANKITAEIIGAAIEVHKALGPGLLESVYEEIMFHELINLGFKVERQKAIPVIWNDKKLEIGFRADLIVENKIIIELKSVEELAPVHYKQLLTYLKLTNIKLGLLINFNENLIKDGIKRVVNNL